MSQLLHFLMRTRGHSMCRAWSCHASQSSPDAHGRCPHGRIPKAEFSPEPSAVPTGNLCESLIELLQVGEWANSLCFSSEESSLTARHYFLSPAILLPDFMARPSGMAISYITCKAILSQNSLCCSLHWLSLKAPADMCVHLPARAWCEHHWWTLNELFLVKK